MRTLLCCLLFCSTLGAGTVPERDAAGGPLWRFVHPNAKALIGVDWARVRDTPLGSWVQRSWIGDLAGPGAVEFLRDVEEILISSPGTARGEQEPPLLIAVRGNFELDRVRQVLGKSGMQSQQFEAVTIFRKPKSEETEPEFALVSGRVILIGDRRSILAAIERGSVESGAVPALCARARQLARLYQCWAAIQDSGAMQNFLFSGLAGKAVSPDSTGFEAGVSVSDGLQLDLRMGVRDEKAARALQAKIEAMLRNTPHQPDGFSGLMGRMRVTAEADAVRMSLRMNAEETATNFHATPARKRVIRIEGLDEGTREVPIGHK